jgi:hypothetical protein
MIIIIESITTIIFIITAISFLTMIFSGLIEDVFGKNINLEDFKNTVYFKYALLATLLSFIILFSFAEYYKSLVRKEILSKFENINMQSSSLYINDEKINSPVLVNAIKNISSDFISQRTNGRTIKVKLLSKNETIILDLSRSIQDSSLYAVYYPKYPSSDANSVGWIKLNIKLID